MTDLSNISRLPDRTRREWLLHERGLRELWRLHGGDPAEVEHVLLQMEPLWIKYAGEKSFVATTAEEAVRMLNEDVQKIIGGLLFALMLREVDLYRLRGPWPAAGQQAPAGGAQAPPMFRPRGESASRSRCGGGSARNVYASAADRWQRCWSGH